MKLAFLLDWEMHEGSQLATAEDGMWEAIRLISLEWEVKVYVLGKTGVFPHKYYPIYTEPTSEEMAKRIVDDAPDAILVWGDFTRPTIPHLIASGIPVALAFTGGIGLGTPPNVKLFFVESASYYAWMKSRGLNVMTAFGVNDRLFKPIKQPKIFDAIFPATFADWKRHGIFANAVKGLRSFCFGYMYHDHEVHCWQYPQSKDVMIAPHLSHEATAYVMNAAKCVVVTSNTHGGSQRTVLEAMACDIPVIVMSDSDKTTEYVLESGAGVIVEPDENKIRAVIDNLPELKSGREYIESRWSSRHYADSLKEGILSIV